MLGNAATEICIGLHSKPERVMPWYCLLHVDGETSGMGVKTGARSFAFWQVDADGISLWLMYAMVATA